MNTFATSSLMRKKRLRLGKIPVEGLFVLKSKYWRNGCRSEMLIDQKKIRKHTDDGIERGSFRVFVIWLVLES